MMAWIFRVEIIFARAPFLERKGEEGGRWLRDNLIGCGPSAIGPTIAAIREHSPWVRNYCYLPRVLKHFGEPAHQQLLSAIDEEKDSKSRAFLISSLQIAFEDFTRFHVWLTDRESTSKEWAISHMAQDVSHAFPDAPPLRKSNAINPDFMIWWGERRNN
jgi:hypothetical protein